MNRSNGRLLAAVAVTVFLMMFCVHGLASAAGEVVTEEMELAVPVILQAVPNPVGADSDEEWFELYNPNETAIDLSGYMVGDEETSGGGEGMYAFPAGTELASKSSLAIARKASGFKALFGQNPDFELTETDSEVLNMDRVSEWGSGSLNLGDTGDELLLVDPVGVIVDALIYGTGVLDGYVPHPACAAGQSLRRDLTVMNPKDCSVQFYVDEAPQPYSLDDPQEPPVSAKLLVSEVMPAPIEGSSYEWIEIHNPSQDAIVLDGFKLGDEETAGGGEGMYAFPAGAQITGLGFLVVASKASSFFAAYGKNPDFEFSDTDSQVPDMVKYSTFATGSINLGNTGDEVLLLDVSDACVDAMCYGSGQYPDVVSHTEVEIGSSLERSPAGQDSDDCQQDFKTQTSPTPGSGPASGQTPCGAHTLIDIAGSSGSQGWFTDTVTAILTASVNSGATLDHIEFRSLPEGGWTSYSQPIICSDEGVFNFEARAIDGSGNIETAQPFTCRIDKTAPLLSLSQSQSGAKPQFRLEVDEQTSGTDRTSLVVKLDGNPINPTISWQDNAAIIGFDNSLEAGHYRLEALISDNAGLSSSVVQEFDVSVTGQTPGKVVLQPGGSATFTAPTTFAHGSLVSYRVFGVPAGLTVELVNGPVTAGQEVKAAVTAGDMVNKGTYFIPVIAMCGGKAQVIIMIVTVG